MLNKVVEKVGNYTSGGSKKHKHVNKDILIQSHDFEDHNVIDHVIDHFVAPVLYKCVHPHLATHRKLLYHELEMTLGELLEMKDGTHVPVTFSDKEAEEAFYNKRSDLVNGWYDLSDDEKEKKEEDSDDVEEIDGEESEEVIDDEKEVESKKKQLYLESMKIVLAWNNFPVKWGVDIDKIHPQTVMNGTNAVFAIRPLGDQVQDLNFSVYSADLDEVDHMFARHDCAKWDLEVKDKMCCIPMGCEFYHIISWFVSQRKLED